MNILTDPVDLLSYLIAEEKDKIGDKYSIFINILNRFRHIAGGTTVYIKKDKTKWSQINILWDQLKHTDRTKKEINEVIASTLEISPHTVNRIVLEIQKGNIKIKNRIDNEEAHEE